jgi:hypothetical protein
MLRVLGMRLLTRLLLLVCSLSLVSLLFLSRCGLNVERELLQQDPGTGKWTVATVVSAQSDASVAPLGSSQSALVHAPSGTRDTVYVLLLL